MKKLVVTTILIMSTISISFAASFDCKLATHPVEKAICQNSELSRSDEELALSYKLLMSKCLQQPIKTYLQHVQKQWLAVLRNNFKEGTNSLNLLIQQYQERNAYLSNLVATCGSKIDSASGIQIIKLSDKKLRYTLPYVISTRAEVGQRINNWIFNRLLGTSAPKKFSDGLKELAGENAGSDIRTLKFVDYSVVRNDNRLLVLGVEFEDCGGAYCETSSDQYIFDTRTGRHVEASDLFTDQGAATVAQRLNQHRLQRAKAIIARLGKTLEQEELDTYHRCLREWSEWEPDLWSMNIDKHQHMRFVAGSCSAHVNSPEDALDNLDEVFSIAELKPYLNVYGKSLLLGVGNVPSPTQEVFSCKHSKQMLAPKNNRVDSSVAEISASGDHHLLLQNDGRLWAWGDNYYGQLGNGEKYNQVAITSPVLVGNDFLHIATGQEFSAGIRRDGSLWTWGSNYQGRLGDGHYANQTRPVRLGENFKALTLNTGTGLALKNDGSLWTWGGEVTGRNGSNDFIYRLTPKQLAVDVVEIEYGPTGQALVLKKDGSLFSYGGYRSGSPQSDTQPWQVPGKFSRIATREGEFVFKADGSLWGWGITLDSVADTRDHNNQEPVELGQEFVSIQISSDGSFAIALKADGSLWASHQRGQIYWLKPIACGFVDATIVGGNNFYVLALKRDGQLLVWGNWKFDEDKQWNPMKEMFLEPPRTIGSKFLKLFQVGHLWGSGGVHAVALKTDGTVWEWQLAQKKNTPISKIMLKGFKLEVQQSLGNISK